MKTSRTIVYAVHATVELALSESQGPIPCRALAQHGGMPERFLLQILRALVKRGVLKSIRGTEGGYCLARSPADITLLDIVDAFGGTLTHSVPDLDSPLPELRHRLIVTLEKSANAARSELRKLTVADLAGIGKKAISHSQLGE